VRRAAVTLGAALAAAGCAKSSTPPDPGLEGLALAAVDPGVAIPGTTLVLDGDSFVDEPWGTTHLRLVGRAGGADVDARVRAAFVDYDHMHVTVTSGLLDELGGDVDFVGDAIVEVVSAEDGETYASAPLPVELGFRRQLTPVVGQLQSGGVIFVNDPISVEGEGLLLGGAEGSSVAVITGCFQAGGTGACAPIAPVEVPLVPETAFSRTRATFAFVPRIAGIEPGVFDGEVTIENRPGEGSVTAAAPAAAGYELISSAIVRIEPSVASLGQYVFVEGGGFVGPGDGAGGATLLQLDGTFTPTGAPSGAAVDLLLVPEFVAGRTVRYVVSEDDALGAAIDLRTVTGTFEGTVTPIVSFGGVEVTGDPAAMTLGIAPVKQVVQLDFRPSYVESLRVFGLRAADQLVRARILEVVRAAYPGINVEFRTEAPADFALYSYVELHGPDPNGMGLFGYDNSPGKDVNNERLYDRLGGVNALTQQDGYPGYGGVFIESLMGFSQHPAAGEPLPGADATFDEIFDPIRPDGGTPITAADLSGGLPDVSDALACPAADREARVACAIRVMGSLVGTTVAHEIGHSLGLANPMGEGFHNTGDGPQRLMDGGADRPFLERAELGGFRAAMFCDTEYDYLRSILPTSEPADPTPRPVCF
jgi:hypothetical protein